MMKGYSCHWMQRNLLPIVIVAGFALIFAAMRMYQGPGLDAPEPVGAFLNGTFPAKLVGDLEATSTLENVNTALVITPEPAGSRVFVAEQNGRIYTFNSTNDGLAGKSLFMDISDRVLGGQDSGLLGFVFHPEYNKVGSSNSAYFYLYYTSTRDGVDYLRLSRFSGTTSGDAGSELVMFEQILGDMMHRGGGMVFGNDGFLYLAIGDLGWMELAQSITDKLSGGVLRIDVDQQGGDVSHPVRRKLEDLGNGFSGVGYYIPNDNPFLDTEGGVFEEYYSVGSRNPHRMTKDRATGLIYIGNVGSNSGDIREEINQLNKGANYGWPFREGTLDRSDLMDRPDDILGELTDPIHEYKHTTGDGCSIIGGYVYRGSAIPDLAGKYIFTDYCSKKVWSLDVAIPGAEKEEFLQIEFGPVTFGEDASGELFIGVQGWHPVYKIVPAVNNDPGSQIPALLSETGAFTDLATLTPAAGVLPYKIIAPLWSDGAVKQRWMVVPNDGTHDTPAEEIIFSEEDAWIYPEGTVLIKHFELALDEGNPDDTRRLETRFLVHGEGGKYYGFTYKWNEAGTDAELLESSFTEVLNIKDELGVTRQQEWYYPARSDCFVCHTSAAGFALGPKAHQLNGDLYYPSTGVTGNQLESLSHVGVFDRALTVEEIDNMRKAQNLSVENASREDRVRSYLDSNCAGCHQPDGGPRSTFDLRYQIDFKDSGLKYGDVIDDLGIPGAKLIVPEHPEQSVLFQRLKEVGTATAMPPLAKNKADADAIALVEEWILLMERTPVELSDFSGLYVEDGIYLQWSTASELNNAGFSVERSEDGEVWAEIAFVTGNGTTTEAKSYDFTDEKAPLKGQHVFYRLKQVDFDGAFEYSDVLKIEVALPAVVKLNENYPNPFNPTTTISYDLPRNAKVKLAVYDTQGRLIQVLVDGERAAGRHEVYFDAADLASGSYFYRLQTNGQIHTGQMLLVK